MTHLDLFSGIGGFAIAAKWAGFETIQFVEYEPYAQKVLAKNFPGIPIAGDIYEFDATEFLGVGLVTGGFPCQPFSHAGKRLGKEDDRAIWPQMLRVIREARPTYVLGENVSGIISMELDSVLSDLENEGYSTQSFVIPAVSKDARHRRDRVWICGVAHSKHSSDRTNGGKEREEKSIQGINWQEGCSRMSGRTSGNTEDVANSNCHQYERNPGTLGTAKAREEKTEYRPAPDTGSGSTARGTEEDISNTKSRRLRDRSMEHKGSKGEINILPNVIQHSPGGRTEEDVSDTNCFRCNCREHEIGIREANDTGADCAERRKGKGKDVADSTGIRQPGQGESGSGIYPEEKGKGQTAGPVNCGGQNFGSSQSRMGGVVDGIPNWMDKNLTWEPEPDIPKVIKGMESRSLRLKGLGNAIVPQVAYEILRCLK